MFVQDSEKSVAGRAVQCCRLGLDMTGHDNSTWDVFVIPSAS